MPYYTRIFGFNKIVVIPCVLKIQNRRRRRGEREREVASNGSYVIKTHE
jgi:hypothetical protein